MIIKRTIEPYVKKLARQFPVVALMGPRQSGKTTLVKAVFPDYAYVTLEDLDTRAAAQEDPRSFFAQYMHARGVIIDEIQEVPDLFSYLQGIVDTLQRPGFFILTGSQHFLIYEKITQTLAGRIALLTLLPLSIDELERAHVVPEDVESLVIKGAYPRLYAQETDVQTWCKNYIATYVEKDVRQVLKISDVVTFQKFLKLCAARIGTIVNYADLARDADMSPHTAKAWLSILEASFIILQVYPYYKNYNKRVIKSPKLYFYDTALVCSLLGIKTAQELYDHPMRGPLFEACMISEFFKYNYHHNLLPQLYFWRDVQGHEIDLIVEKDYTTVIPVEMKAGRTINPSYFKELLTWQTISQQHNVPVYVLYAANQTSKRKHGDVYSWRSCAELCSIIYQLKD